MSWNSTRPLIVAAIVLGSSSVPVAAQAEEPGYEATFRNGVMRHGFATAAGLLIGR